MNQLTAALRRLAATHGAPDPTSALPMMPPVPIGASTARIYADGRPLAAAMLAAIEQAQKSILFETFLWSDDAPGKRFKEALIARAAAGVEVYIIYDRLGNLMYSSQLFKQFPDLPTLHVLSYRSVRHLGHALDVRRIARDHRKLLIVDGEVGFVGGYNISAKWLQWRDTHLELRGRPVADLASAFITFWDRERVDQPAITPPPRTWESNIRVYVNDAHAMAFPIRALYLDAIERARKRIWITTAYFVPDLVLLGALIRAARRGVEVRVLLPLRSEHAVADLLSQHRFGRCLRSGIRIFGYQGAILHAKTATIDGEWTTIGTVNLDRLSLAGNNEVNVELFNPAIATQMEAIFLRDLEQAAEILLADWEARPWHKRLAEIAIAPLWPLV